MRNSRRSMLSRMGLASTFLFVLNTTALGDVTDFIIIPDSPVVGEGFTCEAEDDGTKVIESYQWEFRHETPQCPGPWVTFGEGQNPSTLQPVPFSGVYHIRLTVNYQPMFPDPEPPAPTVIQKVVEVAAPDAFDIVSGLETPVQNGGSIIVQYQVFSQGNPVGGFLGGLAQRKLTNQSDHEGNDIADEAAWYPNVESELFHMNSGIIFDTISTLYPQDVWDDIDVGEVFYKYALNIRIAWQDACDTIWIHSLGSIDLQRRKVSESAWQLERQ